MPYLVLDIGSSTIKGGIISEEGSLLAYARKEVRLFHKGNRHETDPIENQQAACLVVRQLLSQIEKPNLEIRAIAASGNAPTLLALGQDGKPLGPALSWMDRRANYEASEINAMEGDICDASFYLPKALHIWRSYLPDTTKISKFFSLTEYLIYTFCGAEITFLPHEKYLPFYWKSSILQKLSLPERLFPPFVPSSQIVGRLLPVAAQDMGLSPGIPVISGMPDFLAAILGSGTNTPGMGCDRFGTSEAFNLCTTKAFPNNQMLSLPHPIVPLWNISTGLSTAGAALSWMAALLFPKEGVNGLIQAAKTSVPGAHGAIFFPFLAGERSALWDVSKRGVFLGLSLDHDRCDLARAVCESFAYSIRMGAELAFSEGFPFSVLRMSGFSVQDGLFPQLRADILGVPVEVPEILDCELLGNACICALAVGDTSSVEEAAKKMVTIAEIIEPDPVAAYQENYNSFRSSQTGLPTWMQS